MSEEEWRAFHANPTIEGLDESLIGLKFEPIHGCGCNSVKDVLLNHCAQCEYEYMIWFLLDDDGDEWNDHFKDLIICLVDRYPSVEPRPNDDDDEDDELPTFIREFLAVRAFAASGAFSTMHALKKMVGKDAARMIGRVVWSERKNYNLSRPNKK